MALEREIHHSCSKDEALTAVELILGSYPKRTAIDPEIYTRQLVLLLTGYPAFVAAELASPRTGIVTKHPFFPSLSEVKAMADDLLAPKVRELSQRRSDIRQIQSRDEPTATPAERERAGRIVDDLVAGLNAKREAQEVDLRERRAESFRRTQNATHDAIKGSTIYLEAIERMAEENAA